MAIPIQILCLIYGAVAYAFAVGLLGMAAVLGAIKIGEIDPLLVAGLRAMVATILVGGIFVLGLAAEIALPLFVIWFLAAIAVDVMIAKTASLEGVVRNENAYA